MKEHEKYKKELLRKISESMQDLTGEQAVIAKYIRRNYKKVSYMSLEEFCTALNLTPQDVNLFLRTIGYDDDYELFRKALRKAVTVEMKTTDRFQISKEIVNNRVNSILTQVVNKEIQNLNHLTNTFDEEALGNVIQEVMNAPEIIVIGMRTSAPLALYTEYIFNRIGKRTKKIISGGSESYDDVSILDRNALILTFGFARYPKELVKALSFFKKRNYKIISITDNALSPLARFSDMVVTVPCESISFTDSYTIPMCIINTIVISVSQLDEETAFKYLNEFENTAREIGFYF